ncbi:hypothetical protein C4Q28_05590 [Pseudomonas sp. SWI6]|uniref:hypothetical protein n=1 Tax=Pseudomonas sp. SWI6 TaxID=2083051 RepID=UPI000CE5F89A|nr:hypothetical protein [Pseudomonas sp. SWI6]AVD81672.1 hypothetical protein C4Q28_05590 [Pseudomonas sp. SWI6]
MRSLVQGLDWRLVAGAGDIRVTRQKLRRNPRANLGAVFLEILEGHLHANLGGELEHYVDGALEQLPAMLEAAGQTASQLFGGLAGLLKDAASGNLDAEVNHARARQQLAQVALYDSMFEVDAWTLAAAPLAPTDGQVALDNSTQVKATSARRVGVDSKNMELVVLDRTEVHVNGGAQSPY